MGFPGLAVNDLSAAGLSIVGISIELNGDAGILSVVMVTTNKAILSTAERNGI